MREDEAVGGTVGYVVASDPGATLEYSITDGSTDGAFAIDPATGEITTAAALDYLATPSYSLTVAVSDGLLTGTGTIAIAVADVARFEDVPMTHTFYDDIEWLAWKGITKGCNPPHVTHFCPDDSVSRGQMAAFLHRAIGDTLTPGAPVTFSDDDGSIFEADIEWLGSVGVTKGCNPPANDMFCPDDSVTRGQMAAFLHRALGTDGYGDGGEARPLVKPSRSGRFLSVPLDTIRRAWAVERRTSSPPNIMNTANIANERRLWDDRDNDRDRGNRNRLGADGAPHRTP
jgi:hypothetical protein